MKGDIRYFLSQIYLLHGLTLKIDTWNQVYVLFYNDPVDNDEEIVSKTLYCLVLNLLWWNLYMLLGILKDMND